SKAEIESAVNQIKNNKSPGSDNILNEVLKLNKDILLNPLCVLFNKILQSGNSPLSWSHGLLVPVQKL
ncbi:predicted protein, partial [Nematostella vectensis]